MASIFDSHDGDFIVKRLRGTDAAYLAGATRGSGGRPLPIAIAYGPTTHGGPSAQVGAGEQWGCGFDIPALPDLCWVLVQADPLVLSGAAANVPQATYWWPIGEPNTSISNYPPVYGPGSNLTTLFASSAGFLYAAMEDEPVPRTVWCPLDPELTQDGFQGQLQVIGPAGAAVNADAWRVHLNHVRYLGYPVNAWSTGVLFDAYRTRGS